MKTASGVILLWTTTLVLFYVTLVPTASALSNPFFSAAKKGSNEKPKLILISGCPGTGKSTFGMSVALQEGILKCISTDTIRAVMRSFVPPAVSPALHRSSYAAAFAKDDDPARSWKECCTVLHSSVESLVQDAIDRRTSLVVEGVHLIPSTEFIDLWQAHGGVALGCLLQVSDEANHKQLLQKRGFMTGNMKNEDSKIDQYERIRIIQDEMMSLADQAGWMRIEQRIEPDPLDMIAGQLYGLGQHGLEIPKQQMVFSGQAATTPSIISASNSDLLGNGQQEEDKEKLTNGEESSSANSHATSNFD